MSNYLRWRDELAKAIDTRLFSIEYLDHLIYSRHAQFFYCDGAAIVTEVRTYPTGVKAIEGVCAAGDLSEIIGRLIPAAEDWGRENGCSMAIISSREGWAKALRSQGWEVHQVALRKEL